MYPSIKNHKRSTFKKYTKFGWNFSWECYTFPFRKTRHRKTE